MSLILYFFQGSIILQLLYFSNDNRHGLGKCEISKSTTCSNRVFRRLKEFKDTVGMFIFTMDLVTRNCPVITAVENLPYDCMEIIACPSTLGGVVVTSSNSIIHIDQTARRVVLPVNGWPSRVSDTSSGLQRDASSRNLQLEGSRTIFVDDRTLFTILKDGTVYPMEITADGRTVSQIAISAPAARTTVPAILRKVSEDLLFIGSLVGPSVLLKAARVEEEVNDGDVDMDAAPAAVVDREDSMELDDDDDGQYMCHSTSVCQLNASRTAYRYLWAFKG